MSTFAASDAPLLELAGIHKRYGALEVIKGVDLAARPGEVVALIGSSGSGKSTLLRCANLLETPQKGDIRFHGAPVAWRDRPRGEREPADPAHVRAIRAKLSMVFQQFNLWSHMTVLQNVTEAPISVLGLSKQDAAEIGRDLLGKVGLAEKEGAYPSQLSGGQQQRAAIARALAMQPDALLFDEPTSALDPELEVEVLRVIRGLAEEGRTMIVVTHDMKMARDIASRVIFLHHGRVEEEGPPEEVLDRPKSLRLRQFLSASLTTDGGDAPWLKGEFTT